jgi:hypothetical protein
MVTSDVALALPVTMSDTDTGVDEGCSVCAHPMRAHDAIGARFCAATMAGALDRGCVCQPDG